MKFRFEHTCIRVLELEKSIEFYEKALNLKVVSRKDNPEKLFTLVYLTNDEHNFELELTHNHDREEMRKRGRRRQKETQKRGGEGSDGREGGREGKRKLRE